MKRIILFIVSLALSYFSALYFGRLYSYFLHPIIGGFFSMSQESANLFIGSFLSYIFFLPLLFTAFGGTKKYWWIGILLIPAAAFEVYFDWSHIYFPIAIGLIGWLLGLGISKLLPQRQTNT